MAVLTFIRPFYFTTGSVRFFHPSLCLPKISNLFGPASTDQILNCLPPLKLTISFHFSLFVGTITSSMSILNVPKSLAETNLGTYLPDAGKAVPHAKTRIAPPHQPHQLITSSRPLMLLVLDLFHDHDLRLCAKLCKWLQPMTPCICYSLYDVLAGVDAPQNAIVGAHQLDGDLHEV